MEERRKPPEGYRLLNPGERSEKGDLYWSDHDHDWRPTKQEIGKLIGDDGYAIGGGIVNLYARKKEETFPRLPSAVRDKTGEIVIPEGYRRLNPEEIKQDDDLVLANAETMHPRWMHTVSPGGETGRMLIVIRRTAEDRTEGEWGTW